MQTKTLDQILTPAGFKAVEAVLLVWKRDGKTDRGLEKHSKFVAALQPPEEKLINPVEWDVDYLAYALEHYLNPFTNSST